MGRYDTLIPTTQDQVNAMLPAIAKSFSVAEEDVKDIIPANIRMREWDCEKRDHIKERTEDDPRNWGVQFLRDLQAIARLKEGDLTAFQEDLKGRVDKHKEKHPWVQLQDIKDLRARYEKGGQESEDEHSQESYVSDDASSADSYFEELVEPELPKGQKRGRRNHELYEARIQGSTKRRRHGSDRLRRSDSAGWERREKSGKYRRSVDRRTQGSGGLSAQRHSSTLRSEREASHDSMGFRFDNSDEPLEVQALQAELEMAEAEYKATRLRFQLIEARKEAERKAKGGRDGTEDAPHNVD